MKSVLNNSPAPQRGNGCPITAFIGSEPSNPISTFVRTETSTPVIISDVKRERAINTDVLIARRDELHQVIASVLFNKREYNRKNAGCGDLYNFTEGDFLLVARSDFGTGENLPIRWHGPPHVFKATNDFECQVEDLRTGSIEKELATRLKLYRDGALDTAADMSHVLQSETGMALARIIGLEEITNGLQVHVRWKGMSKEEESLEPLVWVYEDVPHMVKGLINRKDLTHHLVEKACA